MSITVLEIKSYLDEVVGLKDQFSVLSKQSGEKLMKVMETVQSYQARMEPLNKNMEQLQVLQKNLKACQTKLNQVQTYRHTGREMENIIKQGPVVSLDNYLKAMENIKEALIYFRQNSPEDVEYSRLDSLYTIGLTSLEREFDAVLKQTFRPLSNELISKLFEQKVAERNSSEDPGVAEMEPLEDIPSNMLKTLRSFSEWMNKNQFVGSAAPQQQQYGMGNIQGCLLRYRDYRREHMRQTLMRVKQILKQVDAQGSTPITPKPGLLPSIKRMKPKRLPGYVWDVNAMKQLNENETEELDSEHYAILLYATVKLMQNERVLLERLELTSNHQESQIVLSTIFKAGSNDILSEGTTLTRLMYRAQNKAEFHMILSLLVVLRKFSQISPELVNVLQGVDHVLTDYNQLVLRLLNQSQTTLESYIQFLQQVSERSGLSTSLVPSDGTIHELTTNALMFLENLTEFSDIIGIALSLNDLGPQGGANALTYLSKNVHSQSELDPRMGNFLYHAILALLANLDHKSEMYSDELLRLIFQMNNIQYVIANIYRTNIHRYILTYNSEGITKINSILDERKLLYLRWCARTLSIPDFNQLNRFCGNQNRALDQKERASLKAQWHDFNTGFTTLTKQHHVASIPDRELRSILERQLITELVPLYRSFWERSMAVSFSTHREKYMRITVNDFEQRLRQLFESGAAHPSAPSKGILKR